MPSRGLRDALLVASAALLAGCVTTPAPPPAPAPVVAPPPAVESLADYLRRTRQMNGPELQRATDQWAAAVTAEDRLRAAIALSAPAHPARDDALAQKIAEQVVTGNGAAPLRDWAALFAESLTEQRRMSADYTRLMARLRDDEKRLEALEARLRELERRSADAERRAADAEKKLEALKQIDKALSDRAPGNAASGNNNPPARPPGNGTPR